MASGVVDIREAGLDDAGAIASVGQSSFRDAYERHSEAQALEAHLEKHFSPAAVAQEIACGNSHYLLATVDRRPAGIAKLCKARCPFGSADREALQLQQLYVLATTQGRGVGRALVEQVITKADQAGVQGVWLSAWEFADWATGFYRRLGFEVIGNVPFRMGSAVYNDLLMWRSVP